MRNESKDKISGAIIILGILIVLISLIGAFLALEKEQYTGAGIFMLAASLPVTVAVNNILKKD